MKLRPPGRTRRRHASSCGPRRPRLVSSRWDRRFLLTAAPSDGDQCRGPMDRAVGSSTVSTKVVAVMGPTPATWRRSWVSRIAFLGHLLYVAIACADGRVHAGDGDQSRQLGASPPVCLAHPFLRPRSSLPRSNLAKIIFDERAGTRELDAVEEAKGVLVSYDPAKAEKGPPWPGAAKTRRG
jgi:hypothetical protein